MVALSSDPASASSSSSQEAEETGPSSQEEVTSSQEEAEVSRETEQQAPKVLEAPCDTLDANVQEAIAHDKQSTVPPMSSASNAESPIMSSSNGNGSISAETIVTSFLSTPGQVTGQPINSSFSMPSSQLPRTSTPPA